MDDLKIIPNVRKNIKISGENDKLVQKCRSYFLGMVTPVDMDYSSMVNMLIEVGYKQIELKNIMRDEPLSGEIQTEQNGQDIIEGF